MLRVSYGLPFLILLSALLITAPACKADPEQLELSFANPDGRNSPTITAEIVKTFDSRAVGMMYRKTLPEDGGMFFIFPDLQPRSFWMKNTYVELDIIYIDEQLQVVAIAKRAAPLTTTARRSTKPAKFVLEINGGKADEWGIGEGSKLIPATELPQAVN